MQRLLLLAVLFDVAPHCGKRGDPHPPSNPTTTQTATVTPTTKATYEPCAGKKCGEPCRICPPSDPSCVETMDLKSCDASGACRSGATTCP